MLITFYGVNNIGKSTHTQRFCERCRVEKGLKVAYLKYPIYDCGLTGEFLNAQLRGDSGQTITEEQLQMWFVLNRMQFEEKLRELLAVNDLVVAEDYIQTGIAWGAAKGASEAWLEAINEPLLVEDVRLLMVGQRKASSVESGHIHENADELVDKCAEILLRRAQAGNWKIVEVQEDKDETAELVWEKLEQTI